ncbi:MAG: ROK family protein [Schumannella sp.]
MRVVGVDVGGTKLAAARDEPGAELVVVPTPRGAEAIVTAIVELVRRVGEGSLDGVGVGSAGTFDERGTVVAATDLIPGWSGMPLADRLSGELGVPVVALNDVHATALGETAAGAGRGFARVLVAATGTGLGGAFVRDGEVDVGAHGSAGSLGHIALPGLDRVCSCGLSGHAEPYASGPGMERSFFEATGVAASLPEIHELMLAGDPAAVAAIESGGRVLGRALATAAALIDPGLVVVGGGPARLGDLLLGPARAAYRADAPALLADVAIVPAALGTRAAVVGAHAAIRARLSR